MKQKKKNQKTKENKIHEAETDTYQGEMDKSIVTAKKNPQNCSLSNQWNK